jgi:hypothetical protein
MILILCKLTYNKHLQWTYIFIEACNIPGAKIRCGQIENHHRS